MEGPVIVGEPPHDRAAGWRELGSPNLRHLEYHEVLERLSAKGDPLAELSASHPPRK